MKHILNKNAFDILKNIYTYLLQERDKNKEKEHNPNGPIPLVGPILRTSLACHVYDFPSGCIIKYK